MKFLSVSKVTIDVGSYIVDTILAGSGIGSRHQRTGDSDRWQILSMGKLMNCSQTRPWNQSRDRMKMRMHELGFEMVLKVEGTYVDGHHVVSSIVHPWAGLAHALSLGAECGVWPHKHYNYDRFHINCWCNSCRPERFLWELPSGGVCLKHEVEGMASLIWHSCRKGDEYEQSYWEK